VVCAPPSAQCPFTTEPVLAAGAADVDLCVDELEHDVAAISARADASKPIGKDARADMNM